MGPVDTQCHVTDHTLLQYSIERQDLESRLVTVIMRFIENIQAISPVSRSSPLVRDWVITVRPDFVNLKVEFIFNEELSSVCGSTDFERVVVG